LGFTPYPGTLNIRLTEQKDLMNFAKILTHKPIIIKGFRDNQRTFGDGLAYPASIEDKIQGAVVRSLRTVYDVTVVELVAPVYLRRALSLKNGQRIMFRYSPDS